MTHAYENRRRVGRPRGATSTSNPAACPSAPTTSRRIERLEEGKDDLLREMRSLTRAAARIANAAADLAELPQGTIAKKRLLLRLWQGLDAASRQSFIQYVSGEADRTTPSSTTRCALADRHQVGCGRRRFVALRLREKHRPPGEAHRLATVRAPGTAHAPDGPRAVPARSRPTGGGGGLMRGGRARALAPRSRGGFQTVARD